MSSFNLLAEKYFFFLFKSMRTIWKDGAHGLNLIPSFPQTADDGMYVDTHKQNYRLIMDCLPVTNVIFRAFRPYDPNRAKHNPGFKLSDVGQK